MTVAFSIQVSPQLGDGPLQHPGTMVLMLQYLASRMGYANEDTMFRLFFRGKRSARPMHLPEVFLSLKQTENINASRNVTILLR